MSTKKICDVCEKPIEPGMAYCQDFNWSLDIFTPLEYHMECYHEKKTSVESAIESLPEDLEAIEPPLGYHVYWEDEFILPAGSTAKDKIDRMYEMTPLVDERYS